jgi:hypothetical protein
MTLILIVLTPETGKYNCEVASSDIDITLGLTEVINFTLYSPCILSYIIAFILTNACTTILSSYIHM